MIETLLSCQIVKLRDNDSKLTGTDLISVKNYLHDFFMEDSQVLHVHLVE